MNIFRPFPSPKNITLEKQQLVTLVILHENKGSIRTELESMGITESFIHHKLYMKFQSIIKSKLLQ